MEDAMCQQPVEAKSLTMEKNWMMMTVVIGNTKSRRKLVPQVKCGMPKRVVCDLETG